MSQPGYDGAWASPAGHRMGAKPAAYAPLVPPQPKKKRSALAITLVTVFAVLIGGSIAVGIGLTQVRRPYADRHHRVTVYAPYSWHGYADEEAISGPITAQEEDEQDGYETEDLYVGDSTEEQTVAVFIDDGPGTDDAAVVQRRTIDRECKRWGCESTSIATPVTVSGRPGVEQVLSIGNQDWPRVEVVLTVRTPTMVVRAIATRSWHTEAAPSPKDVQKVVHSMKFSS